jgi:hypothetical protein
MSAGVALFDYDNDGHLDISSSTALRSVIPLPRERSRKRLVERRRWPRQPHDSFSQLGRRFSRFRQRRPARHFHHQWPRLSVADKTDWGATYAQRPLLFRNLDGKKFVEVLAARTVAWLLSCAPAAPHLATSSTTATLTLYSITWTRSRLCFATSRIMQTTGSSLGCTRGALDRGGGALRHFQLPIAHPATLLVPLSSSPPEALASVLTSSAAAAMPPALILACTSA